MRFVERRGEQWFGYVYVAPACRGEPRASAEGEPLWVEADAVPYPEMWPDDAIWLPRVLAGERLLGDFLFDGGALLAHRLQPWSAAAAVLEAMDVR
jgi:hypothetical protein